MDCPGSSSSSERWIPSRAFDRQAACLIVRGNFTVLSLNWLLVQLSHTSEHTHHAEDTHTSHSMGELEEHVSGWLVRN